MRLIGFYYKNSLMKHADFILIFTLSNGKSTWATPTFVGIVHCDL